jgi:hypothetical protein
MQSRERARGGFRSHQQKGQGRRPGKVLALAIGLGPVLQLALSLQLISQQRLRVSDKLTLELTVEVYPETSVDSRIHHHPNVKRIKRRGMRNLERIDSQELH